MKKALQYQDNEEYIFSDTENEENVSIQKTKSSKKRKVISNDLESEPEYDIFAQNSNSKDKNSLSTATAIVNQTSKRVNYQSDIPEQPAKKIQTEIENPKPISNTLVKQKSSSLIKFGRRK